MNVLDAALLLLAIPSAVPGPPPPESPPAQWIWSSPDARGDRECTLARAFEVDAPADARLLITCDDRFTVRLNGARVGANGDWQEATVYGVSDLLVAGRNVIEVDAVNRGGPGGLLVRLDVEDAAGWRTLLVSDATWRVGAADGAVAAHSFGARTSDGLVWDDPFDEPDTTPAEAMTVPEGFTVELVRASRAGEGSWVSMTFDPEGRVVCGREEDGLLRVDARDRDDVRVAPAPDLFRGAAHGLAFVGGDLYVNVNTSDPDGDGGLWRFDDIGGRFTFGDGERLLEWHGGGEHGGHGVVPGPDGALWIVQGNMVTRPPLAASSPHRRWAEDLLLPRAWDPNGHARGTMAPGSHVLRLAPDGTLELWAGGMRNAYDLAFAPNGDLFTYDSDMEWDVGLPWYRPTRILHLVRAGEYGWRSGSGKWPAHHLDSLPAAVDVGRGSPTGLCFGTDAAFPARYRDALFAGDWSEGRILAVHLERDGTSYRGTFEAFATGRPLNVTDLEIGPDGALWFTTGGRGTQSGLYRIARTGVAGAPSPSTSRTRPELDTLDDVFAALDSPDRFVRYAARIALEARPPETWRERALAETRADPSLHALAAAARVGAATPSEIVRSLRRREFETLDRRHRLDEIRVVSLALARGGLPDEETRTGLIERYAPRFPSDDPALDRELYALLLTLGAPDAVRRGLARLEADLPLAERFFYAFALRDQVPFLDARGRERVVRFLLEADEADGGHSLRGYVDAIRMRLPVVDRERSTRAPDPPPSLTPRPDAEPWTAARLLPELERLDAGRSFDGGRAAYESALCARCHRFAGTGGNGVAPDLTSVSGRFSREDLLEALLDPSAVVSDQYRDTEYVLADGRIVRGRPVAEHAGEIVVRRDALTGARVTLDRRDIVGTRPAEDSPMPPHLLDRLTLEQVLDLLAYLESRGDPEAPAFGEE